MARHTLMEGLRAAVSTVARTAVIADKITDVAEQSIDAWLSEIEQERRQLAAQLAAAQQPPTT